jgi:hypothetical protein
MPLKINQKAGNGEQEQGSEKQGTREREKQLPALSF